MLIPKRYLRYLGVFLVLLLLLGMAYWLHQRHNARLAQPLRHFSAAQQPVNGSTPITTLQAIPTNPAQVALGKRLFFDPRLSHSNTMNCASCHDLTRGGVDGQRYSKRDDGSLTTVNTPTVFNAGLRSAQFWDGRAETLEDQAITFFVEHQEQGAPWAEVEPKLRADKDFNRDFSRVYADGITLKNVAHALAEFQRSLTTPNAPFDRYLRGDKNAISADAQKGYQTFTRYGCVGCHQGMNVGGNMFEQMGSVRDYFAEREQKTGEKITRADLGRFNATHHEDDRHVFKVCSLRNVAKTAPYFHDGSAKTLEDAVTTMARYNLGIEMPPNDVRLIAEFLKTLSGDYAEHTP